MSAINPKSTIPLYHQLSEIVRKRIARGEWAPNQAIPTEREFAELYNVSRTTVRQALGSLTADGYLYRIQGKGTFVAPSKLQTTLYSLKSFSESLRDSGMTPGQKILAVEQVDVPAHVRKQLSLGPDVERMVMVKRLRLANDEPVGIQESYLNLPDLGAVSVEELERYGSLYRLLEEKCNLIPSDAVVTIEAAVGDQDEAELLCAEPGCPLLLIDRTVWSQYHQPLEFVRSLFHGKRYKYVVHQSRENHR